MNVSRRLATGFLLRQRFRCNIIPNCVLKNKKLLRKKQPWVIYSGIRLSSTYSKKRRAFEEGRQLSVKDIVDEHTRMLADHSIPEPKESVEYFVAHVLGKSTLSGISQKTQLSRYEVDRVKRMVSRRLQREPVQYILGEWDFCDLVLNIKEPVFIPRPETEMLVGLIKSYLHEERMTKCRMLEVGCGSGAITLALLKEFPMMQAVAIDELPDACRLTDLNARKYGLSNRLDVVNRNFNEDVSDLGQFDLIVSNPPYIRTEDIGQLEPEVTRFEYRGALDGGEDGLHVVRLLLDKSSSLLTPPGRIWLEVDTVHPTQIQDMISLGHYPRLKYVDTLLDFTSRPRFCVLQMTEDINS